jgi:hypothetical protein
LRAHLLGHRIVYTYTTVIWVGTRLVHRSNQRWPNDVCALPFTFFWLRVRHVIIIVSVLYYTYTSFVFSCFFFVLFFTGRLLFSIPRTQLSVFPFRFYFFRVGSHERRENTANGRRRRRHAKKITQSLSRTWAWLLARGPLNPQSRGGAHLPPSRARIIPVGSSPLSVRPLLKFPPLSRAPM